VSVDFAWVDRELSRVGVTLQNPWRHTDELVPLLKKLRMSGVLQSLELRLRQAVRRSSRTA